MKSVRQQFQFEPLDENPTTLSVETVGGRTIEYRTSRYKVPLFNAGNEYVVRNVVINLISLTKNYHEGRPPVPLPLCPPSPSVGGRLAAKAAREGILWGGSKAERGERENKT